MATLNVFRQDPFTMISMTEAVERNPFNPTGIGELNIFEPFPIRTKATMIEERAGILTLIQTTPRGAAGTERVTEHCGRRGEDRRSFADAGGAGRCGLDRRACRDGAADGRARRASAQSFARDRRHDAG
ncbi:MAG TPA: major capsid protein, partial [Acetobacteraceae bacterium]|nr:major capsid protein [Acetobacteraceae bacterium]